MNEPDAPADGAAETLLARWSRLKAAARARDVPSPHPATAGPASEALPTAAGAEPAASAVAGPPPASPPAIELPDIDQLDQDSDVSAFLTPGVDAELRKRALRKLFHSPKFNVFDGLDTYRDDFTSFPALGDVVTADMRYHLERAAKELAARAEAAAGQEAPAGQPVAITQQTPATAATIEHTSPEEPATGSSPRLPTTAAEPDSARNEDDAEHRPA